MPKHSATDLNYMRDVVQSNPLLGQIALLYYRFARHEQDNALADYVLTKAMEIDYDKYYYDRLLKERGITRRQWDRWSQAASARVLKLEDKGVEIDETNNWVAQMSGLAGLAGWEVEEIESVEYATGELDFPVGPHPFHEKLEALDRLMHNFHAGIAPFEILGASRKELSDLAAFLLNAGFDQLGYVVDEDPTTAVVETESRTVPQASLEGRLPSGTPIRFGDRRPVRVGPYRRRCGCR
jgi:hypothetical protein